LIDGVVAAVATKRFLAVGVRGVEAESETAIAILFVASLAGVTGAAGIGDAAYTYHFTHRKICYLGTDFGDPANHLVSGYHRVHCQAALIVANDQIGMANPAIHQLD
jgi:hypothetical protein